MTAYDTVLYDLQDQVALITLNRPERRNAMNEALNADLLAALVEAAVDPQVRAVVVTGAGDGFCAGADLAVFQAVPTPEQVHDAILSTYLPMMETITGMKKPVLAAVNGVAAGAGASLALARDLRVLAHDASIMMSFSNIALVPDAGASWLLARLVGYSRAYEIAVEGHRVPAERCLELGLANKVAPAEQLLDVTLGWAQQLAMRPTLTLGLTKQVMHFALLNELPATIREEARLQKQTVVSHDFTEGVAAFAQRRKPEFKGE